MSDHKFSDRINRSALSVELVDLLNSMMDADATATHSLLINRVPCNDAMVDHPTVVCSEMGEGSQRYVVGLLGVLNGLLPESCRIAYELDGEADGRLLRFVTVDLTPREES